MSKAERVAVGVVVLLGGGVLMALEVAAFRIIGKTYGTALRETTTVIAVFLAAMSAGYWLGGRAGDRRPRLSTLGWTLLAAAPLMLLVPQFEGVVGASIASSTFPRALHAFAASTILFALPTVLLAAISPIAVRLLATATDHSGRVAGAVSALSTVGSIAGTVVTAFVLLDLLGSIRLTVVVLSTVTLLLAMVLGAASARRGNWARGAVAAGAATAILTGVTFVESRARTTTLPSGVKVLYDRDTPYHHLRVIERPPALRELFFGTAKQSAYVVGDPHLRGHPYEEYKHFAKAIRPGMKSALMIGLGGGTSARQFSGYYDDVTVDVVEIDPVVVGVAQELMGVQPGERLRIHVGDGRLFVRRATRGYDMISIDAYTHGRYGSTIPHHLVTEEFFREVLTKLNDGGICHFHSYVRRDSKFSRALYKTMRSVFPVVVTLGETELFASTAPIFIDPEDLRRRAADLQKHLPNIADRFATFSIAAPRTDDVAILTDDFAPVDTLLLESR